MYKNQHHAAHADGTASHQQCLPSTLASWVTWAFERLLGCDTLDTSARPRLLSYVASYIRKWDSLLSSMLHAATTLGVPLLSALTRVQPYCVFER
jgi:hypothetical protein